MLDNRGGSQGTGEPSANPPSAEETLEAEHGVLTAESHARNDGMPDTDAQQDIGEGFATPCVRGRMLSKTFELIPVA